MFLSLFLLQVSGVSKGQQIESFENAPDEFLENIEPRRLLNNLQDLASPAFQGRELGTPGNTKATDWLEFQFRRAGLKPVFSGSYRQPFPVANYKLTGNNMLSLPDTSLLLYHHFIPAYYSASDSVRTSAVFAGTGQNSSYAHFKVKGRIAILLQDTARQQKPQPIFLRQVLTAQSFGASAVILVAPPTADSLSVTTGTPYRFRGEISRSESPEKNMANTLRPFLNPESVQIPVVFASTELLPLLFGGERPTEEKFTTDMLKLGLLAGSPLTVVTNVAVDSRKIAYNVGGLLQGTAPEEERKIIILAGHFDQQGLHPKSGVPFTGANRNASGVSVLLETAQIMAEASRRPRHSILFIGWNGTERNAAGVSYFAQNTPVSREKIMGVINLLEVAGGTKKQDKSIFVESIDSGDTLLKQAARHSTGYFGFSLKRRDSSGPNLYDFQLDAFSELNIPAISFSGGQYDFSNRLSDISGKLNFTQMFNITHFVINVTWNLANVKAASGKSE